MSAAPPVLAFALARLRFPALDLAGAVRAVAMAATGPRFAVVVTPNAAHLARLAEGDAGLAAIYESAEFCFLDSRVVAAAWRLAGSAPPPVVPGSDLVPALFAEVIRPDTPLCLIGASEATAQALRQRYGLTRLAHVDPSRGFWRDEAEMAALVRFAVVSEAEYTFLAVGSPQQEVLAARIAATGAARGVGLCIGAAVEFAVGTQRRAPWVLRRAGLEWAWRLMREPRRLLRRYAVESPRGVIFAWRAARRGATGPT